MLGVDLTPNPGATRLDLFVTCAVWTGCNRDRLRGVVNFDGATLDISDAVAPQVSSAGNAWSGGWASGAVARFLGPGALDLAVGMGANLAAHSLLHPDEPASDDQLVEWTTAASSMVISSLIDRLPLVGCFQRWTYSAPSPDWPTRHGTTSKGNSSGICGR